MQQVTTVSPNTPEPCWKQRKGTGVFGLPERRLMPAGKAAPLARGLFSYAGFACDDVSLLEQSHFPLWMSYFPYLWVPSLFHIKKGLSSLSCLPRCTMFSSSWKFLKLRRGYVRRILWSHLFILAEYLKVFSSLKINLFQLEGQRATVSITTTPQKIFFW